MKKIIFAIICVALVAGIYYSAKFLVDPVTTEIAYYTTYEDAISVSGVAVFDEDVYKAPHGITVESSVMTGEKVAKNSKIASIYKNEIPMQTKNEIAKLEKQISELSKTALKSNVYIKDTSDKMMAANQTAQAVINAVYSGDVSDVWRQKEQLNRTFGDADASTQNIANELAALRKQRDTLENSISAGKTDIYSKQSGIFSMYIDGFEDFLTVDGVKSMTTADMDKIVSEAKTQNTLPTDTVNAGDAFCKIINSGKWYIACTVKQKETEGIKEGSSVKLRIDDAEGSPVSATVEYISEPDENAKCVLLVSATHNVEGIYERRAFAASIILKQISGLKVSTSAIRVQNDKKGVFVDKQGVATFRPCEILYYNDKFTIVKQVNNDAKALMEYDKVIVSGKNITSGKLLQ